jgi:hypothetical protein
LEQEKEEGEYYSLNKNARCELCDYHPNLTSVYNYGLVMRRDRRNMVRYRANEDAFICDFCFDTVDNQRKGYGENLTEEFLEPTVDPDFDN